MEIKNIDSQLTNYPKQTEIKSNKLKHSIPKNWQKLGITSFLFELIMCSKVFATKAYPIVPLVGGIQKPPDFTYRATIVALSSLAMFITSIIGIIVTKFKRKKNSENRSLKILQGSFIFLFILSIILFLILAFN